MLLEGIQLDCANEAMTIVAMLSVENVYMFQTNRHRDDPMAASRRRAMDLLETTIHPEATTSRSSSVVALHSASFFNYLDGRSL